MANRRADIGFLAALALAATIAALPRSAASADGALHVPSPDWRDQVIYFAMTDRFADGDARNNDQGAGEYDPRDGARYSGGDLAGVRARLDYIAGLGATAVWLTPVVRNQWWDARVNYGGYHGYWADDFSAVDPHAGTLDDYRALSRALHARGMYLVQDVVVNHVGNFFSYDPARRVDGDPARGYVPGPAVRGRRAPSQAPFDRNDPRRARDRAAAIYHWTPDIVDFRDVTQERTWQLAGLDDLNTENPIVRAALRKSYGFWIRETGVDAMRIDTAYYVPPDYFADFLSADDRRAPGMLRVARATGRDDFHVFGEGFGIDRAYEDVQARKIDTYQRGRPGEVLPAMINFPLYGTLGDVFARGRPTAELAWRIDNMMRVHADPHRMPTFVDNHDVQRFLADGSPDGLRQALLAMLTLPGIPTIYYGTEQALKGQRDAMFAGGHGSGGRDRFDVSSPMYTYLKSAIALRRTHRVFSRGVPTLLASSEAGPGVLAYRMHGDDGDALVAFNTGDAPRLLAIDRSPWRAGTRLAPMFSIHGKAPGVEVGEGGRLVVSLAPHAGIAWRVDAAATGAARDGERAAASALQLSGARVDARAGMLVVRGEARGSSPVMIVVDDAIGDAIDVAPDREGRFTANVPVAAMIDPDATHTVRLWSPATNAVSTSRAFRVQRDWTRLASLDDPAGDDHGPTGRYRYPTHRGWADHRQLDIRRVDVDGSHGALRIALTMNAITRDWNPANGFDHVAFTVFIALPGRDDGVAVMPMQHARLPDGMRWHYRLRAHGWSNALFAHDGADADHEGRAITPAAALAVDADAKRVTFTLPASALGSPASLAGAKIYIATWDYDGGFRKLTPAGDAQRFGGGDGTRDPLVMDDALVVLP